jgi:two-component system, NarL family, response regulator NreC
MYRVILADDNAILRQSLKMLLASRDDLAVWGEAENGLELLHLLTKAPVPDIAIVDLRMPRLGGIDAIREIRKTNPDVKLLVLTMHKDEGFLCQAFVAGADGYLLKEDMARELLPALDALLAGGCYVSRRFSREAPDTWLNVFIARKAFSSRQLLSPEDLEFAGFLERGEPSADIACRMSVSERVVTSHRARIMHKLALNGSRRS